MVISGHRSQVSLRNYIGRPLREQRRPYSDILPDAFSLRAPSVIAAEFYGAEQSSRSGKFDCRSFIKHKLKQFVFQLSCKNKKKNKKKKLKTKTKNMRVFHF